MRIFVLIFSLFQCFITLSQDRFTLIEFTAKDCAPFDLTTSKFDSSSLYIIWGHSNYSTKGQKLKMFEVKKDRKIKRFNIFIPRDKSQKIKIKRNYISKKKQREIEQSIRAVMEEKSYILNSSLLNIRTKTEIRGDITTVNTLSISDGNTISFYMIQLGKCVFYNSFEPTSYIQENFPGAEERQKFLNLIQMFDLM